MTTARDETVRQLAAMPVTELLTIGPELAEQWLGKNSRNRPLKRDKIEMYARDIAAGRWQVTGESIKFGIDGRLLDGQNRLHAVIRAGKPITSLVVWGVCPDAQDVMDSGVPRSASDALSMSGVTNAKRVAAAARLAMAQEAGLTYKSVKFTNTEIQTWIMENLDITEAHLVFGKDMNLIPLLPAVKIYCAWRFVRLDADAATEFFTQLATGVGITESSPILALRRRLMGDYGRLRAGNVAAEEAVNAVFRTWNAWRQGRPMERIIGVSRAGVQIPDLV